MLASVSRQGGPTEFRFEHSYRVCHRGSEASPDRGTRAANPRGAAGRLLVLDLLPDLGVRAATWDRGTQAADGNHRPAAAALASRASTSVDQAPDASIPFPRLVRKVNSDRIE